ncbi:hypothetical protein KIW84_073348 [Lathyrus oleraceus]|uniref:Uncharacterized protein n=1 Tax=Pisum sativum TaxID=3888 RepID=A0A9D4ZYU8_PEA|nr:hypothetical protein KIW84_073348 [Pisum sativum]
MQVSSLCVAKFPFNVKAQLPTVKTKESMAETTAPKWAQKTIALPPYKRGCHLVTPKIAKEIEQDLSGFKCGLAHLFLQHTSASLTINENYDTDVRDDTETFLNRIVPEGSSAPWKHTLEGHDDMPAHIKSSMFGCALTIPITNGKLNMGTWQLSACTPSTFSPNSSHHCLQTLLPCFSLDPVLPKLEPVDGVAYHSDGHGMASISLCDLLYCQEFLCSVQPPKRAVPLKDSNSTFLNQNVIVLFANPFFYGVHMSFHNAQPLTMTVEVPAGWTNVPILLKRT